MANKEKSIIVALLFIIAILYTNCGDFQSSQLALNSIQKFDENKNPIDPTNSENNTPDSQTEQDMPNDIASGKLPPLNKTWEGFGKNAPINLPKVYFVTNLNPSGPGSLAEAPSDSYILFNGLHGDIVFPNGWVRNTPRTWIMGQTGNIQIRGEASIVSSRPTVTEQPGDTVWQYIRFRPGAAPSSNSSHSPFAIYKIGSSLRNVVMSHNSFQFGGDDNGAQWYDSREISWLDNIISFGIKSSYPNRSLLTGGKAGNVSFIRNLFMGDDRNPLTQNANVVQLINNFIYTGGNGPIFQAWEGLPSANNTQANAQYNIIANTGNGGLYFNQNNHGKTPQLLVKVYLDGNAQRSIASSTYTTATKAIYGNRDDTLDPNNYIVNTAFTAPKIPYIETDPAILEKLVVSNAGASHRRDALDTSAIDIIKNSAVPVSHGNLSGYGGYPVMTPPSIPDIFDPTQVDGIKASTKKTHGLDPASNTLTTFKNGGTSNDFLAILHFYGLIEE